MNTTLKPPLLPEELFMRNVAWKKVPGYISTYISTEGNIGLLNSKGQLVKPSIQQWSTTKGSYMYARVINDDFIPVQKAIHQLTCLTYHGEPPKDGRLYEPNHINGNKHDNRPVNLEWLTRSANVQHAFDSGLCIAGIRIEALNKFTGEVRKYNSLSTMAREWGIPRHQLRKVLADHRDVPYQNEWTFVVDDSSDKKLNRHQRNSVIYKDYVTGELTITNDAAEAGYRTGVDAGTVVYRLNPKRGVKNPDALLSRYVFKKLTENIVWPEYSVEEALRSEELYKNKSTKGKKVSI